MLLSNVCNFYFMRKISVDKCLKYVNNRFELVLIAAQRARNISIKHDKQNLEFKDEKPIIIALVEIETGYNINLEKENTDLD